MNNENRQNDNFKNLLRSALRALRPADCGPWSAVCGQIKQIGNDSKGFYK
jgi:hypothetical protein